MVTGKDVFFGTEDVLVLNEFETKLAFTLAFSFDLTDNAEFIRFKSDFCDLKDRDELILTSD